jgi:hypothetical protein
MKNQTGSGPRGQSPEVPPGELVENFVDFTNVDITRSRFTATHFPTGRSFTAPVADAEVTATMGQLSGSRTARFQTPLAGSSRCIPSVEEYQDVYVLDDDNHLALNDSTYFHVDDVQVIF